MDMEMLVDMFTRMTEADRKQFAQMLLNKDEKLAREVARTINIAIRDNTIPFKD